MPERVVRLLNNKGAKFSQELVFTTSRGIVADLADDVAGFYDPIDSTNLSRRSDIAGDSADRRSDAATVNADHRSDGANANSDGNQIEGMHVDEFVENDIGGTR